MAKKKAAAPKKAPRVTKQRTTAPTQGKMPGAAEARVAIQTARKVIRDNKNQRKVKAAKGTLKSLGAKGPKIKKTGKSSTKGKKTAASAKKKAGKRNTKPAGKKKK